MTQSAANRKFVDDLLRNGGGITAKRLALTNDDGRDLGGWGREALLSRITAHVNRALGAERERCARIVEAFENTDPDRAIAAAAERIRSGK
ncbi:MAG: hypothetical protein EKK55_16850 [Rhodocyclaceae bacterium]|nr:MAG: hypothetical protein EKK55_16850 [Rhodocyclaceae bacterium]